MIFMSQILSIEELNNWYAENEIDLSWLNKPSRHQFRWREDSGRWSSNRKRISKYPQLLKAFGGEPPTDLYYGTAEWLEPIGLPRIRETNKPAPILLDHLVVFDIDQTPFCHRRLEAARKTTSSLVDWLEENESLDLQYISYSGSKGFHIVLKDLDREKFAIEEPRLREQEVRDERKQLLQRVLAAGFAVDETVTADTRRIIRLPASLHGKTGWICTIIDKETLVKPLRTWIKDIPRHEKAVKMPYWPPKVKAKKKSSQKEKATVVDHGSWVVMEASSHVAGTKDRSALLAWVPRHWGNKRKQRLYDELDEIGWSPCHHWKAGDRELLLVPLAFQKQQMMRRLKELGLGLAYSQFERLGHSWTGVSPRKWEDGFSDEDFEYRGVLPSEKQRCKEPWSNPHLELIQRLGGLVEMDDPMSEDFIGSESCSIRISNFK
jgi:hypothetical protein